MCVGLSGGCGRSAFKLFYGVGSLRSARYHRLAESHWPVGLSHGYCCRIQLSQGLLRELRGSWKSVIGTPYTFSWSAFLNQSSASPVFVLGPTGWGCVLLGKYWKMTFESPPCNWQSNILPDLWHVTPHSRSLIVWHLVYRRQNQKGSQQGTTGMWGYMSWIRQNSGPPRRRSKSHTPTPAYEDIFFAGKTQYRDWAVISKR